ncbi:S1 RNA-binding domain-containing protein [Streptomyces laurentii]|uniref:S1 RNA-binding domain-containing protein n=1 Tax=Streptomyces laurentii TaxID=39478 RepID=UPI0036B4E8A3
MPPDSVSTVFDESPYARAVGFDPGGRTVAVGIEGVSEWLQNMTTQTVLRKALPKEPSYEREYVDTGLPTAVGADGLTVALDNDPSHPSFPGAGFITIPELSWRRIEAPDDVVQVGQRISCEFLQFDTYNAEARLSLRAAARPLPGLRRPHQDEPRTARNG